MKRNKQPASKFNFWQPATDMMSGLVFVLILVIALLCLYILYDYTGYEEYPASSYDASSYDDDDWDGWDDDWGAGWGGWGGGDGDGDGDYEEEYIPTAGGGGMYPDEGIKSAVYVELVDDETDRPIPQEGIRFELYRTDNTTLQEGSLQLLNTYYPEKITYREFATREDGTFYLPEKIWYGDYYFHELNAPDGYDAAPDTYFDVYQLYDWPDPYVVQVRLSPCKNIIRIQMSDADTQLPVGGGTFRVVAAEDITTLDGTVRYTTGQVVDTIECDEEGYGESQELYLGKYVVQQATSPDYYAAMEEDLTVEVERKTGSLPPVHEVEVEKTQLLVEVADELYTDQKLEGAVLLVTDDRSGQTRRLVTDSNGSAVLTDLQKNTTYHIQQTQTVGDYRMGDGVYDVVVSADGRIDGSGTGRLEITNRLLRVSIHVQDRILGSDTINEPVTLYNSQNQVVLSWTTNGQGMELTDLPEGDYYIVHGEDTENPYRFTVADTAEVQTWNISLFTFRSGVAVAVAVVLSAGLICLVVWLVRLIARHRKARKQNEEDTASAGTDK